LFSTPTPLDTPTPTLLEALTPRSTPTPTPSDAPILFNTPTPSIGMPLPPDG
jgi:hypothetical protein